MGVGLIPAHAGKTGSPQRVARDRRAHPRSRGENSTPFAASCAVMGSSPLTRGKRASSPSTRSHAGLIPAHAGKTGRAESPSYPPGAHPRSRGENSTSTLLAAAGAGSSPLTRGKHPMGDTQDPRPGLIPAHAGKTPSRSPRLSLDGAHPRSRGENTIKPLGNGRLQGSSPLTRGKLSPSLTTPVKRGLIPAHAGKTGTGALTPVPRGAHPRSRGENGMRNARVITHWGSSPLTRGKRHTLGYCPNTRGLIPAHAGKTHGRRAASDGPWAHPRSRGENLCGSQ